MGQKDDSLFPSSELADWTKRGAAFILAHPDDEALMFATIQKLQGLNIPLYFLYVTQYGDKGRIHGSNTVHPEEVQEIRKKECAQAMKHLQASDYQVLPYPDMEVCYQDKRVVEQTAISYLRKWNPAGIFSFHPHEITFCIDHPDHRKTGEIALDMSAGINVRHLHPQSISCKEIHRPSIYLWTTHDYLRPTHEVEVSREMQEKRNRFLFTYHPSQFSQKIMSEWGKIFDKILSNEEENQKERWVKIR